jgi:hypothetical protein
MAGVYWVGQDGNYYVKADGIDGVKNVGSNLSDNQNAVDLINGLTRIDDPVAGPAQTTPTVTAPVATTTAAPAKVLNQAGINNTQATIDQIPGLLEAALQSERQRFQNTENEFGAQEGTQRKTYGDSTTTNQLNFDATFMDSIRAGIKGLGGLMSLLRGTGAGGGTAEDLARDTVGEVTAKDIRGGADTREENQMQLDTSLGSFLSELKRKRDMNRDALVNNERAVRRDSQTQLQDLFGKMAGYYGEVGNTAATNDWMARAGALTPEIAANSRTQVSPYDTTPVAVKAPELTAFAAPTQPSVITSPGGEVGSGIFTMSDPRRRRETAPVGV